MITANHLLANVRPPHSPWKRLQPQNNSGAYLSFYFSDDLSALPVRAVTKVNDNKSDPNLETGTYGLFSTCSKQMRRCAIKYGREHILFITRRNNERVIVGYYYLGWYAPTGFAADDFCLAADRMHFVQRPIRFTDIAPVLDLHYSRLCLHLDTTQAAALINQLDQQADITDRYVREIRRLEQYNLSRTGHRYVNFGRLRPFDWSAAADIFDKSGATNRQNGGVAVNSSSTDRWKCRLCFGEFSSKALLKLCPGCQAFGSLGPINTI